MHFMLFILIGLIAGALAGRVVSGHGYGVMGDIAVGIVGAFVGGWLASLAGVSINNILVEIIVAFVGAVILLFVARLLGFGRRAAH